MEKKIIFTLLILLSAGQIGFTQEESIGKGLQAITTDAIKAQLGFLSSDWMEGREAGKKGELLSADYIASMLQLYGVKPAGDYLRGRDFENSLTGTRSYFQNFVILKSLEGDKNILRLKTTKGPGQITYEFIHDLDFTINTSFHPVETEAPVIFAGYGFLNKKTNYNDFGTMDLNGKFVLKMSGYPAWADRLLTMQEINESIMDSERYMIEAGALGVIEFNPSDRVIVQVQDNVLPDPSPNERIPQPDIYNARYSLPGSSFPGKFLRVNISARAAEEVLYGTGINIPEYIKKADPDHPFSFPEIIPKSLYLKTDVKVSRVMVRNIIGVIEGKNNNEIIVAGAHYDHVGKGNGYIWNGADDNGSGTVGIMTLAKAFMATGLKPEKTIVIALWTAEEVGLLGSRYFVQNPSFPLKNIKLNLNFDMISRYISETEKKGVVMTYNKSHPFFREITEKNLKEYNIDLDVDYQPSDDPPGGTDHRSFVEAGIPVMRFKPGHREEYHTPFDEAGTVDWDIMEKIIRISFTNLWDLANNNF